MNYTTPKVTIKTPDDNVLEGTDPIPLLDKKAQKKHKLKTERYNESFNKLCSKIESKIESLNKIIEKTNSLVNYSSNKNSFLSNDEINIKLDEKYSKLNKLSSKFTKFSKIVSTDFYKMIEMSKKSNAYSQVEKKEKIGNQWNKLSNDIKEMNLSIEGFYNYYDKMKTHNVQPDLLSSQMNQFNGNEMIPVSQSMRTELLSQQYNVPIYGSKQ